MIRDKTADLSEGKAAERWYLELHKDVLEVAENEFAFFDATVYGLRFLTIDVKFTRSNRPRILQKANLVGRPLADLYVLIVKDETGQHSVFGWCHGSEMEFTENLPEPAFAAHPHRGDPLAGVQDAHDALHAAITALQA